MQKILFGEVNEVSNLANLRFGQTLYACGVFFVAAFITALVQFSAIASTSGVISGKVTIALTGAPLAGAKVAATSPTGHYSATTNATGFYSMTGVGTDTYTLTFTHDGYEPYSVQGINVFADQSSIG